MARRTRRGFAWMVFPDAQVVAVSIVPGPPFPGDETPPGVVDFWPIGAEVGLANAEAGDTLLVLTRSPEPPPISPTYKVVPAQLSEGDQFDGGLVRIVRVVGTRPTALGDLEEIELETEEEMPIEEDLPAVDDPGSRID